MSTKKKAAKKAAPKKAARKSKAAKKSKRVAVPKVLGFEGALKERKEHFTKHGFTAESDDQLNRGQLLQKAQFALTLDPSFYPPNIGDEFKKQIEKKSHVERINTAMSLMAAEVVRLDREAKASQKEAKKAARKKSAKKK
jgi:hypothetical protein